MSASLRKIDNDINIVPVLDAKVDIRDNMFNANYVLQKPIANTIYYPYSADSWDNSQMSFTPLPSDRATFFNENSYIELPLQFTYTGPGTEDTPDLPIFMTGKDALRAYAFEQILETATLFINGESISVQPYQIFPAVQRYMADYETQEEDPSPNGMLDKYSNYSDGEASMYNVLGSFIDTNVFNPRGAYPMTIVSNTNTSAVIQVRLLAKIRIPPLELLSHRFERPGLVGLSKMNFKFIFRDLRRALSRSDTHPVTLTTITGIVYDQPILHTIWDSIPNDSYKEQLMRAPSIKYPLYIPNRYTTTSNLSPVAANGTANLILQPLTLTQIPYCIYLWVSRADSEVMASVNNMVTSTDTFFRIDSLNMTWGTVQVMSSSTPLDHYNVSVKNGLKNVSYPEWYGQTNSFSQSIENPSTKIGLLGSVIRLIPGIDFALADTSLAPGVNAQTTFQVNVTCTNINNKYSVTPQLNVLFIDEGYLDIQGDLATKRIGVIPRDAVINMPASESYKVEDLRYFGGKPSFSSRFNVFTKNLADKARQANRFLQDKKIISKGLNAASIIPTRFSNDLQRASQFARDIGYGGCQNDDFGSYLPERVHENRGGYLDVGDHDNMGGRAMAMERLRKGMKRRNN